MTRIRELNKQLEKLTRKAGDFSESELIQVRKLTDEKRKLLAESNRILDEKNKILDKIDQLKPLIESASSRQQREGYIKQYKQKLARI